MAHTATIQYEEIIILASLMGSRHALHLFMQFTGILESKSSVFPLSKFSPNSSKVFLNIENLLSKKPLSVRHDRINMLCNYFEIL